MEGMGRKLKKMRAEDAIVTCFTMDDEKPSGILPLSRYVKEE